jgi:hypothetical protein
MIYKLLSFLTPVRGLNIAKKSLYLCIPLGKTGEIPAFL